jgi:hypothetical protein
MDGSFDEFNIETFGEFAFTFEELLEGFVVDFIIYKELLMGEGFMVGERDGVDFAVVDWIFELHLEIDVFI